MSTLYTIIQSLQQASGSNAKQAILEQNKDNSLLKEYLRAVLDPSLSYYQKAVPKHGKPTGRQAAFDQADIDHVINTFAKRMVTGDCAKRAMQKWVEDQNSVEDQELCKMIIDRSIGGSVGETMVLKVWPGLFFTVPYQRCSLLDDKAKARFAKLPLLLIQEKCDGSFLYLTKETDKPAEAITRAGSRYPAEFAASLAEGVPDNVVLVGELLVFTNPQHNGKMDVLDRQTGNGMLNSVLKGGNVDDDFLYRMFAWDILSVEEFKAGKSVRNYQQRLSALDVISVSNTVPKVQAIQTEKVTSLEEAYTIYSKFTATGKEGAVLKTTDFIWKDGTSKDMVKMKITFEIDLEITHVTEGTGKAAGMMGSIGVKSREGIIKCDVGTGWSDEDRIRCWKERDTLPGKILALKANDIISNRSSDTKSLFLPVALECPRMDKTVADSYDECLAILNSAKGLK